ncbi:MAG: hypothetical protein KGQ42_08995, partial [Alphaproteobacteria bacterium]|nr:hypothetical protein [Alphaproteobacteria bacterium]
AYVALLGGAVSNSGYISVPLGKVALGSGEQVALDVNGGGFMQVAVPTSLLTGSNALIDNSGSITARGGTVVLQAAVLKDAVRNVINMAGSINADSATGDGGTIHLIGGADTSSMAGTVTVSGSLSAQATGASGNGGFVETSGAHVNLNGLRVNTGAAHGKTGTWLIDPTDFTIAASGGDISGTQLSTNLGGGNITIKSSSGASGTSGNINVNDVVNWSANTLTLDAVNNINVNAVMNATGTAGFAGIVGDTAQTGTGSATGQLLMGLTGTGFTGTLNLAPTASFSLNGTAYTIITSLGAQGDATIAPATMTLQGINTALSGNYVLGSNIDATATASWNAGAGFVPIGTDGAGNVWNGTAFVRGGGKGFTGTFDGLGHSISTLNINQPIGGYFGLFGFVGTGSSLSNVGLIGGSVGGYSTGGGFGGYNGGTITNAYTTDMVSGAGSFIGGFVGLNYGTISNAYATGAVSGAGFFIGGFVGDNYTGTITNAYATGAVSDSSGGDVGGLVGYNGSTISNAYATGAVSGSTNVGGFVGINDQNSLSTGSISNAYATGAVSGSTNVGGFVG